MSLTRKNSSENLNDKNIYVEEKNSKGEVIKKYIKGRFLGKGGFATCHEFTNIETKKIMAAKIIPKNSLTKSRAKQKLMSEIKIHRSLHHQNIVNFEHFFEDNENVYILLEMCPNQTMNELVRRRKRLTELEVQCYMIQILNACKFLHMHRVIHRDLKLGNLFLSDKMEIKVGDFGLATKLEYEGERKRTICGTPNYIAPEILEGKNGHSYEVDTWSIGVICYTLLIGKPPFETSDVKTTYRRIRMNAYSFPDHVTISNQARALITKILNSDPAKRPSLDEILNHDFFNNGGSIPKLLPVSTLACPPSASYTRQFLPQDKKERDLSAGRASPQRLESTAPANVGAIGGGINGKNLFKERKDFNNTDKPTITTTAMTVPSVKSESTPNMINATANNNNNNNNNGGIVTNKNSMLPNENNNNNVMLMSGGMSNAKLKSSGSTGTCGGTGNAFDIPTSGREFNNENQIYGSSNNLENIISSRQPLMSGSNSKPGTRTHSVGPLSTIPNTQLENMQGAEIWVKKWVDYSSKYGLGYALNNGLKGVFFNDSTKILLNSKKNEFLYVERRGPEKQDVCNKYFLQDYPKDLQKKVTLLQHFASYLDMEDKNNNGSTISNGVNGNTCNGNGSINNNGIVPDIDLHSIYVKKWMKTKHAILFRLSNKVVQVIFHQDQTEIILSSELKVVTYVNKKHERLHFPLNTALESSNQEMAKRLKYTKDILTQMLNGGNANANANGGSSNNKQQNQGLNNGSGSNNIGVINGIGSIGCIGTNVGGLNEPQQIQTENPTKNDMLTGNRGGGYTNSGKKLESAISTTTFSSSLKKDNQFTRSPSYTLTNNFIGLDKQK